VKFPFLVKHRDATATIYGRTVRYPLYRLAYKADGRRRLQAFKTFAEARAEGERRVRQIANEGGSAATLTQRDAAAYKFAQSKLADLRASLNASRTDRDEPPITLTLEDAILEFVEAKRALGTRRLAEAVKGFLATVAQVRRVSVLDAAEEFLKERDARTRPEKEGARPRLSPAMAYQDRNRLRRLTDAFRMDACDLAPEHLDLFFGEHLRDLAPRSRNHFRSTLHVWFKWCVRKCYLPANHRLGESNGFCPDGRRKEPADAGEVQLYTAREFAALLRRSEGPLQVLLAIGGLAGLRTEELLRLEWSDLWRRPGWIEITRGKAKTRQRRLVPVCPALAAWLGPWRRHTEGRVFNYGFNKLHRDFRAAAEAAGVRRRDNALRHAFISCRLALVLNEHQVAGESGTSPQMLHTHYRELVTPDEARAWFNVLPEGAAANIVSLPAGGAA